MQGTILGQSNKELDNILNLVYPIGRGFIDFTNTDYSNYLGFVWERELVGMFPVGYNLNDEDFNELGKMGGEKYHILTIDEMPSHTHLQNAHSHSTKEAIAVRTTVSDGNETVLRSASRTWSPTMPQSSTGVTENRTAVNNNTGGGQEHNNLPPYQVVAYWKRVE